MPCPTAVLAPPAPMTNSPTGGFGSCMHVHMNPLPGRNGDAGYTWASSPSMHGHYVFCTPCSCQQLAPICAHCGGRRVWKSSNYCSFTSNIRRQHIHFSEPHGCTCLKCFVLVNNPGRSHVVFDDTVPAIRLQPHRFVCFISSRFATFQQSRACCNIEAQ